MANKSTTSIIVALLSGCLLIWFGLKQFKVWFPNRNIPNFVHDAVRNSEFEFLSLSPVHPPANPDGEIFHGFESLGSIKIKNHNIGELMIDSLDKSVGKNLIENARCYWPRHGIRIDHHGDQIELIVCFECGPLTIYRNGQKVYNAKVSNAAKSIFDQILQKEGLPIDTPPW
jgi:hypothetical protein